jgi:hypothetical protein
VRDEVTEEAVVVAGNRNKIVEVFFAWKKKKKTVYLRSLWFEFLLDVNLFTFWTEETLIEDKSLSFCTCNGERWRRLFSFYKLLMILKETSDMENLLQMVHLSGLFMVWESIQTFPSRNRHVLVR